MRVQLKNGQFAAKNSSVYRFVNRTGKTVEDYYKWARECGLKASHNAKDSILCKKYGIKSIEEISEVDTLEIPDNLEFKDLNDFILSECTNVADIAASWLEVEQLEDDSKFGFINDNLSPITKVSFERWGDINTINQVSPSWFKANGMHIDVQAMSLSELYGREINEEDIVEFLLTFRKGRYKSLNKILSERYEERFEELSSFKLSKAYAIHLRSLLYSHSEEKVSVELESETAEF